MDEFPWGRAKATEADRDYVTRLLAEQVFLQNIGEAERDRRLRMVVRATYVNQVAAALEHLPPVVPSRYGQSIPARGDRARIISALNYQWIERRISKTELDQRKLDVYLADTTFELAAAVYGLPPAIHHHDTGELCPAPIDDVGPGLTDPLGRRDFLRHPTLESVFADRYGRVDDCDWPALHRAYTTLQARNALGVLVDPPPLTGDLLTEMTDIHERLDFLIAADAGKLRNGRQRPAWNTVHAVPASEIKAEAERISTEFRADDMLRGLTQDGFAQKFGYYLWRLVRMSAFADPYFAPTSGPERILLSLYAHDAGWQVDWTKAPSRPPTLIDLLAEIDASFHQNSAAARQLRTALGAMISPVPEQSGSKSTEWATADVERLGFRPGDGRLIEALGVNNNAVTVALRAETGRDRAGSQLGPAGERRGVAPADLAALPGRRSRNRRRAHPGTSVQRGER